MKLARFKEKGYYCTFLYYLYEYMKNKIALILFLCTLISCDERVFIDSNKESSHSMFIKNVSGNIVQEIPHEVFERIINDIGDKTSQIQNSYTLRDSIYVIKRELYQIIDSGTIQKAYNNIMMFTYRTHLQDVGWTQYSSLGQTTGTIGEHRRLEALEFSYTTFTNAFKVRVHVVDGGWLPWVGLGDIAGTTGKKKRIEAVQINVNSSFATNVYYQVYMQDIGWGPLVGNGEIAGTIGEKRRVEAFRLYMYII
ncbi:hypothetical protein [uncultured Bacteroides sp.]|uniref:hypothetical protein n=1 Tax=uncultured Bacteroides sp. TaxID=162156 RepID=UPI0025E6DAAC|nr:hypothetical protein [uncultured Bacteroides sp.]